MRYVSICSGIEAASVAWKPLGWEPLAFSEIEPFPCAVLAHHYPAVPNVGNILTADWAMWRGAADVVIGGTPCQAFSVAGLRRSLDDARGNLTLAFVEVVDAIGPQYVVWENVPGVLSTKDNAFGCFLAGLVGAGEAIVPERRWPDAGVVSGPRRVAAWRCLDAQYFGLAQRRKRVFVVACPRSGADPRAVLFEPEGMRRDSPPRREAGEGITHAVAGSITSSGRGVERPGESRGQDPVVAVFGGNNTCGPIDIATACSANGGTGRSDFESETFVTHALRADGFDASEDGTGCGTPIVPVAFSCKDHGADAGSLAPTLRSMGHDGSHANAGGQVAIAQAVTAEMYRSGGATAGKNTGVRNCLASGMAIRRLTPRKCERLQGFPDDYTLIQFRGKPASDGPCYKAIGNSMAVPCIRWIGQRIERSQAGSEKREGGMES